jgi:hypothetical protein
VIFWFFVIKIVLKQRGERDERGEVREGRGMRGERDERGEG